MRFKSYVKYFFAIACIFASALFLSNDAIASGGINSNEIRVLSLDNIYQERILILQQPRLTKPSMEYIPMCS